MTRKELFTTIRTEGAILPSDLLQRIGELDKALPGLKPLDFGMAPTERINEATARSWTRLQGLWVAFRDARAQLAEDDPAVGLTRERWLLPLFAELGFGHLKPRQPSDDAAISHAHGEIPLHLLGVGVSLDRRTPKVSGAAKRSPHALAQEYLNGTDKALYGFVSNGRSLRLLRDNSSLTRQAFVEFDLEGMFEGDVYPDFQLLWLTCHATRLEGDPPATCLLERWSQAAAEQGARALDKLREGVKEALTALGSGFLKHPANQPLKDALRNGELTAQDYYRELLRVVYRLLFLFVAEDREVLHPPEASEQARARYARHFSTRRVRDLARRHRGGRHPDLWQAMQVVIHALGDPEGLAGLGLPSLGGLFATGQTPHLDEAQIANHELMTAVRALAFTREGRVVRSVDYRNLGPEEFGSVYESLLDQHPEADADAGTFGLREAGGSERKTTGSYYTPPSLVQALLDSALDPVIERAAAAADPEAEILNLRVVDPASGSGHFLIVAAHRIALRLAAVRTGEGSPAPDEVRHALRDVVGRCIYGVDVNPMAVELCKVSLWIEAVEPGKPLSFLDQHIRCGNSLVGVTPDLIDGGIPLDALKAITGDDKEVAKERRAAEKKRQQTGVSFAQGAAAERLADLRSQAAQIAGLPDETPDAVTAKAQAYRELVESDLFQATRAAFDAWCAAIYLPKTDETSEIGSDTVASLLADHPVEASIREAVMTSAKRHRFFHYALEFPDVMVEGFDCVLGNPPWEKVEFKEQEYFAVRSPAIARASGDRRKRMIAALRTEDPSLFDAFQEALRESEAMNLFVRTSGRYPLTGQGRVNTYSLFAESMRALLSASGRLGCIVPTGIATDDTTKYFFADLVERNALATLYDFENRKGLFPAVDSRMRFCLLSVAGAPTGEPADFAFFAHDDADLHDPERRFTLDVDDFALLNPNTRTCPIFRSRRDAEITKAIYRRVGVLVDEKRPDGNPWNVSFAQGLFNMTSDSHLFRERADLQAEGFELQGNRFARGDEVYLPLYEAKMIHQFDHRAADVVKNTASVNRQNQPRYLNPGEKRDPRRFAIPTSWVQLANLPNDLPSALLGFCDITSATNERTVLAAIIPRTAVGHSLPLMLMAEGRDQVLPVLNSLVFDYASRQKVGGLHLTFFVVRQLPVPPPGFFTQLWQGARLADWLRTRVLELVYTAWDVEPFARDLDYGGAPFRWDPERRFLLRAELDAAFFHVYGISREDADYILDTFPIVRANDIKRYGSYRTKEVVLDLYDRMAKAAETGVAYETVLDPPPAHPSVAHPASSRPAWSTVSTVELTPRPATLTLVASPPSGKERSRYVPVVNLKAAAGSFGSPQEVEPEGWLELPHGTKAPKDSFVAQVVGRSMEPTIPDGARCLFTPAPAGSRNGKILLVEHHDIADPETGGSYTIKRYRSEKAQDADTLWRHARVILEPDNPDFEPIVLEPESEDDVRVVGEFREVLGGDHVEG